MYTYYVDYACKMKMKNRKQTRYLPPLLTLDSAASHSLPAGQTRDGDQCRRRCPFLLPSPDSQHRRRRLYHRHCSTFPGALCLSTPASTSEHEASSSDITLTVLRLRPFRNRAPQYAPLVRCGSRLAAMRRSHPSPVKTFPLLLSAS